MRISSVARYKPCIMSFSAFPYHPGRLHHTPRRPSRTRLLPSFPHHCRHHLASLNPQSSFSPRTALLTSPLEPYLDARPLHLVYPVLLGVLLLSLLAGGGSTVLARLGPGWFAMGWGGGREYYELGTARQQRSAAAARTSHALALGMRECCGEARTDGCTPEIQLKRIGAQE